MTKQAKKKEKYVYIISQHSKVTTAPIDKINARPGPPLRGFELAHKNLVVTSPRG